MPLPRVLEPGASGPNLTLGVLALAGLAFALLQSLVAPALTTIQHEVRASESGVTRVLTSYLLSAAVATPILGRLGDVYGKRRVLIVALGGLAAGAAGGRGRELAVDADRRASFARAARSSTCG